MQWLFHFGDCHAMCDLLHWFFGFINPETGVSQCPKVTPTIAIFWPKNQCFCRFFVDLRGGTHSVLPISPKALLK